jgi:hypothetical protein
VLLPPSDSAAENDKRLNAHQLGTAIPAAKTGRRIGFFVREVCNWEHTNARATEKNGPRWRTFALAGTKSRTWRCGFARGDSLSSTRAGRARSGFEPMYLKVLRANDRCPQCGEPLAPRYTRSVRTFFRKERVLRCSLCDFVARQRRRSSLDERLASQ